VLSGPGLPRGRAFRPQGILQDHDLVDEALRRLFDGDSGFKVGDEDIMSLSLALEGRESEDSAPDHGEKTVALLQTKSSLTVATEGPHVVGARATEPAGPQAQRAWSFKASFVPHEVDDKGVAIITQRRRVEIEYGLIFQQAATPPALRKDSTSSSHPLPPELPASGDDAASTGQAERERPRDTCAETPWCGKVAAVHASPPEPPPENAEFESILEFVDGGIVQPMHHPSGARPPLDVPAQPAMWHKGECKLLIKRVNARSGVYGGALFRLRIQPVDPALREARPELTAYTEPFRSMSRDSRAERGTPEKIGAAAPKSSGADRMPSPATRSDDDNDCGSQVPTRPASSRETDHQTHTPSLGAGVDPAILTRLEQQEAQIAFLSECMQRMVERMNMYRTLLGDQVVEPALDDDTEAYAVDETALRSKAARSSDLLPSLAPATGTATSCLGDSDIDATLMINKIM